MSHLACADEPDHPMNPYQLDQFKKMTDGITAPRSLAATGGILLGPEYHFDLTRPGIGLYGGLPFEKATPVSNLICPSCRCAMWPQARSWATAMHGRPNAPFADRDGVRRLCGRDLRASCPTRPRCFHGDTPCPLVGRVSMDLLTIDVTDLPETPSKLYPDRPAADRG